MTFSPTTPTSSTGSTSLRLRAAQAEGGFAKFAVRDLEGGRTRGVMTSSWEAQGSDTDVALEGRVLWLIEGYLYRFTLHGILV